MERAEGFQSQFEIENADFVFEGEYEFKESERNEKLMELDIVEKGVVYHFIGTKIFPEDEFHLIKKTNLHFKYLDWKGQDKKEGLRGFVNEVWFSEKTLYFGVRKGCICFWFGEREVDFDFI